MRRYLSGLVAPAILLSSIFISLPELVEAQNLTVEPVTWDIVGLDSNRPLSEGPSRFMIGARVTNTGASPITNLSGNFVWTSDFDPIQTTGPNNNPQPLDVSGNFVLNNPAALTLDSLAPGEDFDVYWNVNILTADNRDNPQNDIFDRARPYQITIDADMQTQVATPLGRQLYVESIQSQNRNEVISLVGPTSVFVGQTYEYVLTTATSPGGFEQLVGTIDFPNTLFQIRDIQTTYENPAGQAVHDEVYADACGWDPNQFLIDGVTINPNYNSCVGAPNFPPLYPGFDKVGGNVVTIFQVAIISTTAPTITVIPVIYDFSGSSFHYNTDYNAGSAEITIQNIDADLGGRIYRDNDSNGDYAPENGETGFTPVTVNLYTLGPDMMAGTPDDVFVTSTTTDSDGVYFFQGLAAGDYHVSADGSTGGLVGNQVVSGSLTHTVTLGTEGILDLDAGLTTFPLLATIDSFGVTKNEKANSYIIDWVTSEEIANIGFNLYHANIDSQGSWAKGSQANDIMIFSKAGELGNGAKYTYTVPGNMEKAFIATDEAFFLEDVDTSGKRTLHGPAVWEAKSAGISEWIGFQ